MTKRETYCTVRGLKVWATAGLMLILVLSSGPAWAADIYITSCMNTEVKICSWNQSEYNEGQAHLQAHNLKKTATARATRRGHFNCKHQCYFTMTQTQAELDSHCGTSTPGGKRGYHRIDHKWGSGNYQLIKLARTGTDTKDNYKSSDLRSVALESRDTCP